MFHFSRIPMTAGVVRVILVFLQELDLTKTPLVLVLFHYFLFEQLLV